MKRVEKEHEVARLSVVFSDAAILLFGDYRGLTVAEMNQLRRSLRAVGASLEVVKNTLARLAVAETSLAGVIPFLSGTTVVVFGSSDPVAPAKVLVEFLKSNEKFSLKAGFLSGRVLDKASVHALSSMPSREQLLSSLLGSVKSPAQGFVNVLSAVPRQLVTVLAAVRDQKGS